MGDFALVMGMAAITYGSRVVFLVRPGNEPSGRAAEFLDAFPLALFVALATSTLLVGDGVGRSLGIPAFVGAVAGGVIRRGSLIAALVGGGFAYWMARLGGL